MSATAAKTCQSVDAASGRSDAGGIGGIPAEELRAANINPRTGLATDYLNHFNEAVMLLEMIPDMPDCAEDFLAWQPLTYCEHFQASHFKGKDLAIRAYEAADPAIRGEFDAITDNMTAILTAVADAMCQVSQDRSRAQLAERATAWVKPLVMTAGGVINGPEAEADEADVNQIMTA